MSLRCMERPRMSWVRSTRCFVLTILLCLAPSGAFSWSDDLQAALAEQSAGRTFAALEQVQALIRDNPDVGRLRMEAATLHLSLNQFSDAEREIRRVLDDPALPEGVRVNAQMLLLTVQRSARQYSEVDTEWALTAEAGYLPESSDTNWSGSHWLGMRGLARYESRSREPMNWHGRPLWLSWQAQLVGYQRYYEALDDPLYQVDMSAGPVLRLRASRLEWSVGYLYRGAGDGPFTRVFGETALSDQWSVYGQARSVWLDTPPNLSGSAGLAWQVLTPLEVSAELTGSGGGTSATRSARLNVDYTWGRLRADSGLTVPLNDSQASADWHHGLIWRLGPQWRLRGATTVPVDELTWNQTAWQMGLEWQN